MHLDPYSELCHIYENLWIFRILTYLKPVANLETSRIFRNKIVKNYTYFSKALHLRFLTGFWIGLSLNNYSLTCRVTSGFVFVCYIFRTLSLIVNSDIFRHIVAYLWPCVALTYSESCDFQNTGIFRTQDIFRTLSRHILAYPEHCVTLAYWKPCHIQNFAMFRILAYLGPEAYSESYLLIFRYIQAYSIMIVIITLTFFFHFNLTYFSTKSKKTSVFWLQWRHFQCLTQST